MKWYKTKSNADFCTLSNRRLEIMDIHAVLLWKCQRLELIHKYSQRRQLILVNINDMFFFNCFKIQFYMLRHMEWFINLPIKTTDAYKTLWLLKLTSIKCRNVGGTGFVFAEGLNEAEQLNQKRAKVISLLGNTPRIWCTKFWDKRCDPMPCNIPNRGQGCLLC